MKQITLLLAILFLIVFSWQSHAQFTEHFDTDIPTTWTIIDVNGGDGWVHSTINPYSGAGQVSIRWDSDAHDDYLISPSFTVTTGISDRVSFFAGINGTTFTETFDVMLSTTAGSTVADFDVTLASETATSGAPNHDKFEYDLSAYDGQTITIAIKATDTDRLYLYIDEFVVDTAPLHTPVATLADLRAGTVGNQYEFTGEGYVTAARLSASGDGSMRVFGQDATAGMQFYAAAGIITATTINFGDGVTTVKGMLTEVYGNLIFVVEEDITLTGNNQQITPEVVTALDYTNNREDYEAELIKVLGATINPNGDVNFGDSNNSYAITDATGGLTLGVVFPQLNGVIPTLADITGIAVEYITSPLILPRADVDIESCPGVTNISASNFTHPNNADLTWDASTGATGYNWEIQPQGTAQGDATIVEFGSVTTNAATATTLVSGTDYTLYVQSDCGSSVLGNWASYDFTYILPPLNDNVCDAEMLILNAAPTVATNALSTGQTGEPNGSCWSGTSQMNSVWYTFVSNGEDTLVTTDFDTALNDTHITVYEMTDCTDMTTLTEIGCDEDGGNAGTFGWNSRVNLTGLTTGTTYYIQVDGYGSTMDEFNLQVVTNDIIAGAIPITPSAEGAVCDTNAATFTAHLAGDGTTDSGMDGSCNGASTGLDRFYTWTATSIGLVWNDGAGNPGIVIRDATGIEITCEGTFASDDVVLSGWNIGDDLIIQIYDFNTADVDVTFCLAEVSVFNPEISLTTVNDCANNQFTVDVDVTTLGGASAVTVSDDQGSATQNATATGILNFGPYPVGTTVVYTVVSDDDATNTSSQTITFNCPPINDNICDAIALTLEVVSPGDAYSNLGATGETNEPVGSCFANGITGSVWFTFVAPASGNAVTVTTDIAGGTNTDTEIAIYEAPTDCTDASTMGAQVGCDQDGGSVVNFNSIVTLSTLTAGNTYYVQVDNWNGTFAGGTFGIEVREIMVSVPDCATLVSPLDNATDVVSPFTLTWIAATTGDPADSYNLYVSINGGAEFLFNNYTDTFTPSIGLQPGISVVWRVVPVNAAGENTTCTTTFSFSSVIGTDDYDGDGVDNLTEYDPNADGVTSDGTDMANPCDPAQTPGYTGYDATNVIWAAADCDGDGQTNGAEDTGSSDPYDANSTVSIKDLTSVGFEYYPNPVSNSLTVKANENITNIAIFNMLGQKVKDINPSSLDAQIDMKSLTNGTYFIKATVGDAFGTFKIIKK